ncbi:MAG: biopolymer transporter ExbD [Pseudomonadota bacterium]
MALKRVRKRRPASITSLIDVIFLLLLFFMLASTFTRFSEIELASAEAVAFTSTADRTIYRLQIAAEAMILDGAPLTDTVAETRLSAQVTADPGLILLSVTPDASTQRLVDVLTRLNGLEGATLRVVAEP